MDEFTGKVALITGAGRGIGREIALAFASLGVTVAANDINPINLDETVELIRGMGGKAKAYVFDIAKRMPIEGMVSRVMDDLGSPDILINHASVDPDASILEMDEWEFHRTLDVNLAGPFFCIQQVGRLMQQGGGGSMVNILSAMGQKQARKGKSAYFSSQTGILGLTQAAASELSADNIRLNAICYRFRLPSLWLPQRWSLADLRQWRSSYPMLCLGDHPDVVSLAVFLCSDTARSITGQILTVDQDK